MEIWKDIELSEGCYQVSNLGRVKSMERLVKNKHSFRLIKEKIKKQVILKDGYYYVSISNRKAQTKQKPVHQLMAIAFLNHKPCKFEVVVDHKDNNKLNNKLDNLQLLTNRQNSTKDNKNRHGYIGVSISGKKLKSSIRIDGKSVYLGTFNTAKLAHEKYVEVRKGIECNNLS